jgi:hypothetical protein
MRYVGDVFESVVQALPTDVFYQHKDAIDDVRSSIAYSAPELEYLRWIQLQELIVDIVGDIPELDWHYEVLSIFSTVPTEEIRQEADAMRSNHASAN